MNNEYITSIITLVGIIVANVFTLIGIIVQTRSSNKVKKQNELLEEVDTKINKLQQDSDFKDKKINKRIDELATKAAKSELVATMSKIENGYIPTIEEKRILIETYDFYTNTLHGNSYVHEMFEKLKSQNMI